MLDIKTNRDLYIISHGFFDYFLLKLFDKTLDLWYDYK